jgi:hypothetical protein
MSATAERARKLLGIKKALGKGENSMPIQIVQSEIADWNPTGRMFLLVLALGTRTNPEAYLPEDCPYTKAECLGWCDMSQWRLALRVGCSESQINRMVARFEKEGVIRVRHWTDDNNTQHCMYQLIDEMVKFKQRPSQKPDTKRPSRYSVKRGANKGSFSTRNQPQKVAPEVAEMDEEQ